MFNANLKLVYSSHAQKELQDAVTWYNKQKKGLGSELKVEIKKIINEIIFKSNFCVHKIW